VSAIFAASSYGKAALYWDPNGQILGDGLGPKRSKYLAGNATESVSISSNIGFPVISPYSANVASPVRFHLSGPSAIVVFPVRFGLRFGFVPDSWNYATLT
jgi:hypothetical protein